jgi:hypothetical protein
MSGGIEFVNFFLGDEFFSWKGSGGFGGFLLGGGFV